MLNHWYVNDIPVEVVTLIAENGAFKHFVWVAVDCEAILIDWLTVVGVEDVAEAAVHPPLV